MDINKLTQKSQEALQSAQTKALRYGHQEVDGEHLLLALLEQPEGLVPRLLARMEAPTEALKAEVERELSRRPKVSGPGAEAGKIYLTQRLQQIFLRAEDEAKRLKDEYVSVEHLLLAMIEEGSSSPVGKVLASFNINSLGTSRPQRDVVETTSELLKGGHWMKITPKQPLDFGEYALMEVLSERDVNSAVWDFGVHPTAPENRDVIKPQPRRPVTLEHR